MIRMRIIKVGQWWEVWNIPPDGGLIWHEKSFPTWEAAMARAWRTLAWRAWCAPAPEAGP